MTRKFLNVLLMVLVAVLLGIASYLIAMRLSKGADENQVRVAESMHEANPQTREKAEGDLIRVDSSAEKSLPHDGEKELEEYETDVESSHKVIRQSSHDIKRVRLKDIDIRLMSHDNPLYAEARKVLNGNLEEKDSLSRRQILGYCEHLRQSYQTKDIDFIRQVFSDDALIIVGHVVKSAPNSNLLPQSPKVRYTIRSKSEYLKQLEKVFATNKKVKVDFSDFRILRHPSKEGIYGVSLHQKYASDRYSDDGYLFLLWDFRDPSMPKIHVRTWQPRRSITSQDDLIEIGDFNLE